MREVLPPIEGRFFQCRKRGDSTEPVGPHTPVVKDDAFLDFVDHQQGDCIPVEKFPEEIWYRHRSSEVSPTTALAGATGAARQQSRTFVYLDVGAWFGGGGAWGDLPPPKPTADDPDPAPHPAIKRDFGIVCGPHVLLCTFESTKNGVKDDRGWVDRASHGAGVAIASLNALLEKLSSTTALGRAIVRRYVAAPASVRSWGREDGRDLPEKDWTIHVIVGDTHIPMVDRITQSLAGGVLDAKDSAVHETDWLSEVLASTSAHRGAPRVRRYGRFDLEPMERFTRALVPDPTSMGRIGTIVERYTAILNSKWAQRVNLRGHVGELAMAAALFGTATAPETVSIGNYLGVELASELGGAYAQINDLAGVVADTMPLEQAERWYKYYREGDGGPPAAIFENAGDDLLELVRCIHAYAKEHEGKLAKVQFHQLGDMFDFWVGFTCHYRRAFSVDLPAHAMDGNDWDPVGRGREMVGFWMNNCLSSTQQGQSVAKALDLARSMDPKPAYLFGNHDNYLGTITPHYWSDGTPSYDPKKVDPNRPAWMDRYPDEPPPFRVGSGKPTPLDRRTAHFDDDGLFMEHGHQWDNSNRDDAPIQQALLPFLGTPAPLGEFLTQAAFIRPVPIRGFEGPASAAAGSIPDSKHPYGQRLWQIAFAIDQRMRERPHAYCYAMGHTHVPCLTLVHVDTGKDPSDPIDFREDRLLDPSSSISIEAVIANEKGSADRRRDIALAGSVRVDWRALLGSGGDWVAIADPFDVKAPRRVGLFARVPKGRTDGSILFADVPPGAYQARAYLEEDDGTPWRTSPSKVIVPGLSIERAPSPDFASVPPPRSERFVLRSDGTFDRDVVLRWAFHPSIGDWTAPPTDTNQRFYFLIVTDADAAKSNESPQALGALHARSTSWKQFREVGSTWEGRVVVNKQVAQLLPSTSRKGTHELVVYALQEGVSSTQSSFAAIVARATFSVVMS